MAWSRWFSSFLILGAWLFLCGAQPVPDQPEKSSCVRCHHEATVEPYGGHLFSDGEGSVHAKNRVGCEDCHGGNPSKQDKEAAHRGVHPSNNPKSRVYFRNVPFTCGGRCHTKEYKGFIQSDHYRKLETSGKGPNCVTCHGSMAYLRDGSPAQRTARDLSAGQGSQAKSGKNTFAQEGEPIQACRST